MIFVTRKRSSIEMHVSRKAESIRRLFWLDYPGTVWRMKQCNLFYCHAVFLFPHTRFIRCYESLPAYAWKGFLFVRIFSESRNNSEFSHCSSCGKEKSKFFHSEGLKTRGCFCIWWRISDPAEKTEYFFRQHGCIFPPRCPKKMEDIHSPLILDNWIAVRTGYDFATTPKGQAMRRFLITAPTFTILNIAPTYVTGFYIRSDP